jgi:1,4-dihydroxy-2-naphthoate octaprenyltransferase
VSDPLRLQVPADTPCTLWIWLQAARPRTLPAAVVPVLVGLALAARRGRIDAVTAALTMSAAVLLQIGTNLANDYYDFIAGADTGERVGPRRITQAGLAAPETVRRAAFAVLGLAGLAGLYLVAVGGWPIAAIGVLSLLAAVGYTTGPWPIAYHGLGELFVFAFFGIVAVNGTLILQMQPLSRLSLLAALPVACLATAILVVNNLRDIATDARAGKRTIAVRLGERATRIEYLAFLGLAFLAVPALAAEGGAPLLVSLAALPLALYEARALWHRSGGALNASLAGTARLHLAFGMLLALGLAL